MSRPSYGALWARRLIRTTINDELLNAQSRAGITDRPDSIANFSSTPPIVYGNLTNPLSSLPAISKNSKKELGPLKVCIIGAGISGLYIALLLDSLNDPDVSYEMLEASTQAGRRVQTHRFSGQTHGYCDTGAMRFPDIPLMRRAFRLFDITEVPLIPYYLEGPNCPTLFNDVLRTGQETEQVDPFRFGVANGGLVPDRYAVKGASQVLEDAFKPFKDALAKDFEGNFDLLLKQDQFSTREYLRDKQKYDFHTVQWLETMCSVTGYFDQSFTESVLDSLDFDYPHQPVDWHCIDGGGSMLVNRLLAIIKGRPSMAKCVTSISINRSDSCNANMMVKVGSEATVRPYSTVFNTTSLSCMQRMDLTEAELHPAQKEAIRSLHYDSSTKVAMKFSYPWWITKCGITKAGVASTDLPLRLCVYPSYSVSDGPDRSSVLLVSYTWSQDTLRMGELVTDASPKGEGELRELIFRDLARLHAPSISYEEIVEAYVTHYAFDWTKDKYASGAFTMFSPGQFSNLFPYLSRPTADAKLHMVGEATSAHHVWLVGSLDSAYRAVHHFLQRFGREEALSRLESQWGVPDEMETGGFGTAHVQMKLGRLRPEERVQLSAHSDLEDYVYIQSTDTI